MLSQKTVERVQKLKPQLPQWALEKLRQLLKDPTNQDDLARRILNEIEDTLIKFYTPES